MISKVARVNYLVPSSFKYNKTDAVWPIGMDIGIGMAPIWPTNENSYYSAEMFPAASKALN